MFRYLKKAKGVGGIELDDKPLKTKRGHIHMFYAVSYPIYLYESTSVYDIAPNDADLLCGTF